MSRTPPGFGLAIIAAVIGLAVFLFIPAVMNDGDTYWHIRTGEWILAHRAVPAVDIFSATFAGKPWVTQEWLSEVFFALAWHGAGWNGVLLLSGAAFALTLFMMALHLSRWVERLPAVVMLVIGAACVSPSLLARPHILALPVLELWTAGLLIARSRGKAPSWGLLPLMGLWANMHGSFLFGLVLILPLAAEALIEAGREWQAAARGWGLFAVAAVVATLITPHGLEGLIFPFQLMKMQQLSNIGEWAPTDFHIVQPMELGLMALMYVSWTRAIKLPPMRIAILCGLLYLALAHSRHQLLAGVVGVLVVAGPLGQAFGDQPQGRGRIWPWLAGAAAIVALLCGLRLAHPASRKDEIAAALAHVPADVISTPVFNDYAFGGNLIFHGLHPFIDSRADLYGDDFLAGYSAITKPSRAAFAAMADQHAIRWTIMNAGSPLVDMLDHTPGWHRIYADQTAVVHVRDGV